MISAADAIAVGRGLLGTPYAELDCINFIKKIIRTAPGGDRSYTDAHVPALWASYKSSGKYRHLTAIYTSIVNPRPGMLAFKGQPLGYDHEPEHVGLVTGPTTVIHSSSAKGGVVETDLINGQWTLLAEHRYISVAAANDGDREDEQMDVLYRATVMTESGNLNLRAGPTTSDKKIASIPRGSTVDVCKELSSGWDFVTCEQGIGYVMAQYLSRIESESDPGAEDRATPALDATNSGTTTIMNDSGQCIIMVGHWHVAQD